ncbi:MAG: hypothetical protein ABNO50_00560 [Candidatus Shikimatogenerans sp. Tduv]|uniref:DNA-directed RNA polymerase RpoA/D/Rpb3-type domain-containing protein n=1 Tax=Candidatus Shikimatogenerans sp. Tduv TaxID=3158567 RepID=A0AAU7QQU5_9FLAO
MIKDKKKFLIVGLRKNIGITIGNSLRRVLLTSIKGYTVSAFRINKIKHEYESIDGVYEDINNIILNLKQIIFKNINNPKRKIYIINIKLLNKKIFFSKYIEKYTKDFKIINKDLKILNCSKNIKLNIKLIITYGRGYIPANNNLIIDNYINKKNKKYIIKIDSIYTPIINVKYKICKYENIKEKLIISITTNKTITPIKALYKSVYKLIYYYYNIIKHDKFNKNKKKINPTKKLFKLNFKYFKYFKYFNNDKLFLFFKKNYINNINEFKKKYKVIINKTKNKYLLNLIKKIYKELINN